MMASVHIPGQGNFHSYVVMITLTLAQNVDNIEGLSLSRLGKVRPDIVLIDVAQQQLLNRADKLQ